MKRGYVNRDSARFKAWALGKVSGLKPRLWETVSGLKPGL